MVTPMRTGVEYHVRRQRQKIMRPLALWLLLAAPASAAAHSGALPGEAFTFKFSVGPIESGRARMSVGLPVEKDGRRLLAVHGQAETLPWLALVARMNDDYKLVVDAGTLIPVEVTTVERGIRERRFDTGVHASGRLVDLSFKSPKDNNHARRSVPDVVRDPLSALFAVRAAGLRDGDALTFLVIDGMALWRSHIDVKRQILRTEEDPHGKKAIRLDGTNLRIDDAGKPTGLPARRYTCWLSDDADRVLLRMEAEIDLGKAVIELTSYSGSRARGPVPALPGMQIARQP
jgi:hypothetical protein